MRRLPAYSGATVSVSHRVPQTTPSATLREGAPKAFLNVPGMLKAIAAGPGWLSVGAVILAMVSRFLPHPWNFTPVGATFLFCGFATRRPSSLVLPLAAYVASDIALDLFVYRMPLGVGALFVWLGFALVWLIGRALRRSPSLWALYTASLAGSIAFFLVSNFGVWLGGPMYPRTLAGLSAAYTAAIPFFQNTIVGDLIYNTILFGLAAMLVVLSRRPLTTTQHTS